MLDDLKLVDGPGSDVSPDRGPLGRALVDLSGKLLDAGVDRLPGNRGVNAHDRPVLLGEHQEKGERLRRMPKPDGEKTRDGGVECTAVPRLRDTQKPSHPCDDLVARRTAGLVERDYSILQKLGEASRVGLGAEPGVCRLLVNYHEARGFQLLPFPWFFT